MYKKTQYKYITAYQIYNVIFMNAIYIWCGAKYSWQSSLFPLPFSLSSDIKVFLQRISNELGAEIKSRNLPGAAEKANNMQSCFYLAGGLGFYIFHIVHYAYSVNKVI